MDAEGVEDVAFFCAAVGGGGAWGVDGGRGGATAPFVLFGAREVVWGVDVACAEAAEDLAFEVGAADVGVGGGADSGSVLVLDFVVAGDALDEV